MTTIRGNPKDQSTNCADLEPACPTEDSVCFIKTGKCVNRKPSERAHGKLKLVKRKNSKYWVRPNTEDEEIAIDPKRTMKTTMEQSKVKRMGLFGELLNRVNYLSKYDSEITPQLATSPPKEFAQTALEILESPPALYPNAQNAGPLFVNELLKTIKPISPIKTTTSTSVKKVSKMVVGKDTADIDDLTKALSKLRVAFESSAENNFEDDEFELSPVKVVKVDITPQTVTVAIDEIFKKMQHKFKIVAKPESKYKFEDEDAWENE